MDLNRIDLNLLVAFDALMAERSVTRAAQRLSIGQSAMSSTLARLRRVLDDPVLVREGRVLIPTPRAEQLEVPVREVLGRIAFLLGDGHSFDPAVDDRLFTVMATDYVAVGFLHPLMVRLATEAPRIRLNVRRPEENPGLALRRHEVDLAILPRQIAAGWHEFEREVLFEDRYVCVVDRDHPDVGDTLTLAEFGALPYLASTPGGRASVIEEQLDRLGIERRTEFTTGVGLSPMMLRGTRLIALVPERLGRAFADTAGLRLLDPPMELEPITALLLWSPRFAEDEGHRWLRRTVIEMAAGMNDR